MNFFQPKKSTNIPVAHTLQQEFSDWELVVPPCVPSLTEAKEKQKRGGVGWGGGNKEGGKYREICHITGRCASQITVNKPIPSKILHCSSEVCAL